MSVVTLDTLSQRRALLETKRELDDAQRRLVRTEKALSSLRDVLSLLPDPVEVIGEDLLVYFANRASRARCGGNPEGQPYHTLLTGRHGTPENCPVRVALEENREIRMRQTGATGAQEEIVITPTRLAGGQRAVMRFTRTWGQPPAKESTEPSRTTTGADRTRPAPSEEAALHTPKGPDTADGKSERDTARIEQWADVEALREWSTLAAHNINTNRFLGRILPCIAAHFHVDRLLYYRFDGRARRFSLDGEWSGDGEYAPAPVSITHGEYRTLRRIVEADVPYLHTGDAFEALPAALADLLGRDHMRDSVVLPVRSALSTHGALVASFRQSFTARGGDDQLLRALAQILGAAIERNGLIRTLKRNVSTLVDLQRAGRGIAGATDLGAAFDLLGRTLVGTLRFSAARTRITGAGLPANSYLHSYPGPFHTNGDLSQAIVEASATAVARNEIEILESDQTLRLVVDRGYESQLAQCRSVTIVPVHVNATCFGVIQLFSRHTREEVIAMKSVVRTFVRHAETALKQSLTVGALRDELDAGVQRNDIAREIVARVQTPVAVISPDGRITLTNPAFLELIGCDSGNIPDLPKILFSDRVGKRVSARELAQGLMDRAPLRRNECTITHTGGHRIPVELSTSLMRDGGELLATFRDMRTEQKLRRQLTDALKLSLAGERIAGLTHQVNNYLTPAFYHTEQLLAEPSLQPSSRSAVATVQNYLNLCHESITMVLQIIRPAVPGPIQINELIEETLVRICSDATRGIGAVMIDTHYDTTAPVTVGYRVQLQQAIANIVSNAQEAIADSGGEGHIVIRVTSSPATIRVAIEDDGPGMTAEFAARAFDLGVTSKPPGSGTGVGLHFAREVIRQHHGSIALRTQPGHGACFSIRLPVREPDAEILHSIADPDAAANGREFTDIPAQTGRLLIVDDEPAILELFSDILKSAGHTVTTAKNADKAVEAIRTQTYDCIICDIRMPGMGGAEFSELLRNEFPELYPRLVFVTGDIFSDDTDRFLRDTGIPFVEKPFTADSVHRAVQCILSANGNG